MSHECMQPSMSLLQAAIMSSVYQLPPLLLLLCASLLCSIQFPSSVVSASSLSFDVQFTQFGYDPQMVLFHVASPKNLSGVKDPFTAHRCTHVLPRKKRKTLVAATCDCSRRFDGVMYARPAPLRGKAATGDEVASFKMTLCLKTDRQLHGGGRIGLFLFLVPYPWNARDERVEVGLDSECTESLMDRVAGGEAVVCAHVHYDSTRELLLSTVRIGGSAGTCGRKLDRRGMPRQAAVGFSSTTAGDFIKFENIFTWAFHSALASENDAPLMTMQPQEATGSWIEGEQRLRVDPWNQNAELSLINLRYQQNWLHNFQLTCSVSVSVGYGNAA